MFMGMLQYNCGQQAYKSRKQFIGTLSVGSTIRFSLQTEIWKYHFACVSVPAADYCLMKDFKTTLVIVGISKPVYILKKKKVSASAC